jgi:hypothetical protein
MKFNHQKIINTLLNYSIVIVLFLLLFSIIIPTQLLFDSRLSFDYYSSYYSVILPSELLAILLPIFFIAKGLNFNEPFTRWAISLLIFNCYSFFLLTNYFPLFYLDGYEYSEYYVFVYQLFISISNYITLIFGLVVLLTGNLFKAISIAER